MSPEAIKEFVLIPQHTTPNNTTKELDALYDVLQHVKKMWKTEVLGLMDFIDPKLGNKRDCETG